MRSSGAADRDEAGLGSEAGMEDPAQGIRLELAGQHVDVGSVKVRDRKAVRLRMSPEEPVVPRVGDDGPLEASLPIA